MKEPFYDSVVTAAEAAKVMGCSEQYIRKLLRNGKLPGQKVGSVWLIPTENILEMNLSETRSRLPIQDHISTQKMTSKKRKVLSFFSGAMGLDLGLAKAGFETLLACENDPASRKTIAANRPDVALIGDILDYSVDDILRFAGARRNEIDLIVGGPPCQAFSTAGKRMGFQDVRGNVFLKYLEIILEVKPKYAVFENVRGLLSSKFSINLEDEISGKFSSILKDTPGSALYYIIKKLESGGYTISFNLYNSANYGSPQGRERVVIICHRGKQRVPYLRPTHSDNPIFGLPRWNTFKNAVKGLSKKKCDHAKFSEKRLKYFRLLSPGQYWKDLPKEMQQEAMGNSYFLGGGKTGFFRRLAWDKPSPTLVTHPAMPATELGHPTEDRPLSVQEYKRIQEFPDDWQICGSLVDQYRQIGNAVPTSLGEAIGNAIAHHMARKKVEEIPGFPYSRYKFTSEIDWFREFKRQVSKAELAGKETQCSIEFAA